MKLLQQISVASLLFAALLVSGCTSVIRGDVVTYHDGPMPAGETIRVVAANPANQGSLEFRSYVTMINEQLRRVGYQPTDDDNAQLLAVVDYSVAPDSTSVTANRSQNAVRYGFSYGRFYDPFYFGASNYWGPNYWGPGWGPGYFGGGYWGPDTYTSRTGYLRTLLINIERNDQDRERLFEGHVQSSGAQNLLPQVMPYLITAMFQNYPGENGVTKVVTIERNQQAE
jgi:hypothetical protein